MSEMTKEEVIECINKHGVEYVHIDWPEFLNTEVHGINKSRYIASWANAGGNFVDGRFYKWLLTIKIDGELLTEEEADEIEDFATGGKLELEINAGKFLAK